MGFLRDDPKINQSWMRHLPLCEELIQGGGFTLKEFGNLIMAPDTSEHIAENDRDQVPSTHASTTRQTTLETKEIKGRENRYDAPYSILDADTPRGCGTVHLALKCCPSESVEGLLNVATVRVRRVPINLVIYPRPDPVLGRVMSESAEAVLEKRARNNVRVVITSGIGAVDGLKNATRRHNHLVLEAMARVVRVVECFLSVNLRRKERIRE